MMDDYNGQEELAGLFARQMTFSNPTPPPEERMASVPEVPEEQPRSASAPMVYASQHYTPNRHVVPVRFNTPPEPPVSQQQQQKRYLSDEQLVDLLQQNSVDPHQLFPSQVDLFRNADADQRLRLLELWRISPPNLGAYDIQQENAAWAQTDLQKEELLAKMRYERRIGQRGGTPELRNVQEEMGWGAATAEGPQERPSTAPENKSHNAAEPYMLSGYEQLSKRDYDQQAQQAQQQQNMPLQESTRYNQSTDPVFQHPSGLWQKSDAQEMENQYGAFLAMRENQVVWGSCMLDAHRMDEDMIM